MPFPVFLCSDDRPLHANQPLLYQVPEGGVCQCVGQALAVVLTDTAEAARVGARAVVVTYEETGETPVLSFAGGIERKSFLPAGSVKEVSVRALDRKRKDGMSVDSWMV